MPTVNSSTGLHYCYFLFFWLSAGQLDHFYETKRIILHCTICVRFESDSQFLCVFRHAKLFFV